MTDSKLLEHFISETFGVLNDLGIIAKETNDKYLMEWVRQEVLKITSLKADRKELANELEIFIVGGSYKLVGRTINGDPYLGLLNIKQNENIIEANWEIGNNSQCFDGRGIVNGQTISMLFSGSLTNSDIYKGLVSYYLITPSFLKGQWLTQDSNKIGVEYCWKS
ncbi:MAG: hypothetical protein NXI20_25010 [bacterium]|nr:hypothetical protein [bacterium]